MKKIPLLLLTFLVVLSSCKKDAGEGGKASIKGFVWLKEYNGNFASLLAEREAFDVYVYIQYGDDVNYSDRIKTNYEGKFEFNYLRPGKYKIYTYSKDPSDTDNLNPDMMMAVVQDVEITEKKAVIELDTMVIFD